jgi:hypothetical protein
MLFIQTPACPGETGAAGRASLRSRTKHLSAPEEWSALLVHIRHDLCDFLDYLPDAGGLH